MFREVVAIVGLLFLNNSINELLKNIHIYKFLDLTGTSKWTSIQISWWIHSTMKMIIADLNQPLVI